MEEIGELASIPLEPRAKVYFVSVRPALLYADSCDHRILRYMLRVRWKDRITNEKVRRRCGWRNLIMD